MWPHSQAHTLLDINAWASIEDIEELGVPWCKVGLRMIEAIVTCMGYDKRLPVDPFSVDVCTVPM